MRQAVAIFLCLFAFPSAAGGLYSRDLDCGSQPSARGKKICRALEQALAWTWTGHAIISPSFRVNTESVRDVYCSLPITAEDTRTLIDMVVSPEVIAEFWQSQLDNGVRSLLSMLGQHSLDQFPPLESIADPRKRHTAQYLKEHISLTIAESSSSIFSPSHRLYILRDGCP